MSRGTSEVRNQQYRLAGLCARTNGHWTSGVRVDASRVAQAIPLAPERWILFDGKLNRGIPRAAQTEAEAIHPKSTDVLYVFSRIDLPRKPVDPQSLGKRSRNESNERGQVPSSEASTGEPRKLLVAARQLPPRAADANVPPAPIKTVNQVPVSILKVKSDKEERPKKKVRFPDLDQVPEEEPVFEVTSEDDEAVPEKPAQAPRANAAPQLRFTGDEASLIDFTVMVTSHPDSARLVANTLHNARDIDETFEIPLRYRSKRKTPHRINGRRRMPQEDDILENERKGASRARRSMNATNYAAGKVNYIDQAWTHMPDQQVRHPTPRLVHPDPNLARPADSDQPADRPLAAQSKGAREPKRRFGPPSVDHEHDSVNGRARRGNQQLVSPSPSASSVRNDSRQSNPDACADRSSRNVAQGERNAQRRGRTDTRRYDPDPRAGDPACSRDGSSGREARADHHNPLAHRNARPEQDDVHMQDSDSSSADSERSRDSSRERDETQRSNDNRRQNNNGGTRRNRRGGNTRKQPRRWSCNHKARRGR
jgi:hypothetical protein